MSEGGGNSGVITLVVGGLVSIGCLGVVALFSSAMLVAFLFSGSEPEGPQQFEQLRLTPPGSAQVLPPLPRAVPVGGPPLPEQVIHEDQCGDLADGGPVKDGCITDVLGCDEMVIGHTIGGVDKYDSTFYQDKRCWPRTIDHDGGDERIYRLEVPPGEWRAFVTLLSPCADLTLGAMRYDGRTCPTEDSIINQCEMSPKDMNQPERLELVSQTEGRKAIWYLVVEGVRDEEGPFSLHVQCARGLHGGM